MKNNLNTLNEISIKLKTYNSLALFCHIRPDGDTIGSAVALMLALKKTGKNVDIFCDDEVPEKFYFIEDVKMFSKNLTKKYDAYVSVDCSDIYRLGTFGTDFLKQQNTFSIDHHISNTKFAKYNYVKDTSSNCENIYNLILELGIEIDKKMSNALLMGVCTDTGNFSHKNTNENSLYVASKLLGYGADINDINYRMFRNQSKERAKLFGMVMSKIRFFKQDRLAIISVLQKDLIESKAPQSATEGFIDFAMDIETVEVAICLSEVKDKSYKISFRSKKTDVNEIASFFGGGGHILASGCMLNGYYEDVIEKLVFTCSKYMAD